MPTPLYFGTIRVGEYTEGAENHIEVPTRPRRHRPRQVKSKFFQTLATEFRNAGCVVQPRLLSDVVDLASGTGKMWRDWEDEFQLADDVHVEPCEPIVIPPKSCDGVAERIALFEVVKDGQLHIICPELFAKLQFSAAFKPRNDVLLRTLTGQAIGWYKSVGMTNQQAYSFLLDTVSMAYAVGTSEKRAYLLVADGAVGYQAHIPKWIKTTGVTLSQFGIGEALSFRERLVAWWGGQDTDTTVSLPTA